MNLELWSSVWVLFYCSIFCSSEVQNVLNFNTGVKKTTFSATRRMLFFAGLEGTGHHHWKNFIDRCVDANPTSCKNATIVSDKLFGINFRGKAFGIWSSELPEQVAVRHLEAKLAVQTISNDSSLFPELITIGLEHCLRCGMMSYPNFAFPDKTLDHPDIRQLAGYAEEGGVDLRVVVLMRSARGILESTVKRGFGLSAADNPLHSHYRHKLSHRWRSRALSKQPLILLANAESLYTQLLLLDPAFYFCVEHEDFEKTVGTTFSSPVVGKRGFQKVVNPPLGRDLFEFIHPTVLSPVFVKDIAQQMNIWSALDNTTRETIIDLNHTQIEEWLDVFEPMLASRLNLIQELCEKGTRLQRRKKLRRKNVD